MKHFLVIIFALLLSSCAKPAGSAGGHADSAAIAQESDYYTCPMHPQIHESKPGVCPICHMDLVKASNSRNAGTGESAEMVQLTERDRILANVATVRVEYEEVEHTVRAFGNLDIAEPNKTLVSARFTGRIEKLHVDAVGARVNYGDPLFEIYSPDLIQASNEYVQSLQSNAPGGNSALMKSKLRLLGLTDDQVKDLETSGKVPLVTTYTSPASGTVIEKKVVTGSYVAEGTTLYEISDISTLWNIVDVYDSDAGHIVVGEMASFTTEAYPDKTFKARVTLIYPVVNPQARSVKVRLAVDNAAGRLRPNMYTSVLFRRSKGRALTVPVNAVLLTGKRNLVYVKTEQDNHFQAREVGLGSRFNGKYEITFGLEEGDEVVAEGGYLIDSESQLKAGMPGSH